MQFYPQLLLWTYVLLPAISLLLSPTFFIALARAQQQRAKIMTNALAARGRAAAALARANSRRYLPRYSSGLSQFKPFKLRTKRELEMGVPEISIDDNPKEADKFERKSHWDQQEESLGQLENMWNMNNFGISQNDGVRSVHDKRPEKSAEKIVGSPFINSARSRNRNDGKSDYYAEGGFSGRNVFDSVLEQSEPGSIIQGESEPPTVPQNGAMGMEDTPAEVIGESPNTNERVGNPDPTLKKLKKKLKKKQEPHQQNYYNYYYPQYSHGSSYNSHPYGRSDESEANPQNVVMGMEDTPVEPIDDSTNFNERVGNPEPTFKKLKKKLNKKQEPHQQNYYNYYFPQYPYGSPQYSHGSPQYAHGSPQYSHGSPQYSHGSPQYSHGSPQYSHGSPQYSHGSPQYSHGSPQYSHGSPQYSHGSSQYSHGSPQYSHESSYNNYPYGRSDEAEAIPQNVVMGLEDTPVEFIGDSSNTNERVGNPDPTLKKLKKKLNKKQEPHQQNYYNYYYPQYSHGGSHNNYPYERSDESEAIPQNVVMGMEDTPIEMVGDPSNTDERVGNPDPTLKKLKKKLNKKQEPHQQNYYNYYYPQYSHGGSHNNYPYQRSDESEAMPQNGEMKTEDRPEAIIGDPSNTEDRVGNPEPTFKKLKKKLQKKLGEEHQPYPYPQNDYHSYYPQDSYPNYYRNAETEGMHQDGVLVDDMAMTGEQSFHDTEPKLGDPEPQYNPYSRASQRGKMLQNMEEHQMDNFMMGELILPRFAHPEPTFKKKKETTTIEHMPPSFYYPQNQYNAYYSPNEYSNSYYNPYARSTEKIAHNKEVKSLDERVGNVNPFEEEQKSANPEPHHNHKKIEGTHSGGEKNFFYSSNFYERDNEPAVENGGNMSKQESNDKLQGSLNGEELQAEIQKGIDEPKILGVEENLNLPKGSEQIPPSQGHEHGTEDVGCGLDEKIEKKLAKKLKKLLKKDKEEDTNKMEYPYPPMYPPSPSYGGEYKHPPSPSYGGEYKHPPSPSYGGEYEHPPSPSYGGEYEQPEYYRSASESQETINNNKQAQQNQTIVDAIKDEKKNDTKNEGPTPLMNPSSSPLDQPGTHRSATNAGKPEQNNKQVENQKNMDEPLVAPIYQHISMPFNNEFADNTQEPQEEFHVFEERFNPASNQNDRIPDRPINEAGQTMVNSRSASYMEHVHDNPEDVGCELDDNLLDPDNAMKSLDPYNVYQRTVEGISEESKNIAETAKKLLQPQHQTPAMIKPPESAISYVDFDEVSKHGYEADENAQPDLISFDRSEASREKSADPNANPHLSHNHGSTHTHTHFISHTHGHNHQKGLSKLHGGQGVHPINSQVFPHQHGVANSGFSQANANAQTFNHGGHHSSIANANSKTFGNGFGSNGAIAQSNAQAFNGGQINNFGLNSATAQTGAFNNAGQFTDFIPNGSGIQGFNNGGSFIQNGHHLAPSAAIAQSQALTNGVFGQSGASANSLIQNGQPNTAIAQSQAHNNGGFGQSAAHALAQSGLGGNIGPQTFEHGFQNTPGLAFSNNPGQFAGSLANAQIVGQRHEHESFVMPHLEELPVKHLFGEMKSGTHRLSRSPQDIFEGVRLASGIVDASLDRNSFLDGAGQQRTSEEPKDMPGTMGYVSHIVDSSIRAGESNTQRGNIFNTHSPRYSESESARGLAFEGISSITDLVNSGLRVKRHDAFGGLRLASDIVDSGLNRDSFLDGTVQQRTSDEPQDTTRYVTDIVDSGIRAGKSNTQKSTNSKTNYLQSESARGLPGKGVSSIMDLVNNGLGVKRQIAIENKNNFEESLSATDEVKVPGKQRPDQVLENSDESGKSDSIPLYVNKKVDPGTTADQASISENNDVKNTGIGSQGQEKMVLGIANPDKHIFIPETVTNQPEASDRNYKNKAVIYVTPVSTDLSIDNDSSNLEINTTVKNQGDSRSEDVNLITTSENLGVTAPVNKQVENNFQGLENPTEILLTNSSTEKTSVSTYDDITDHTSDLITESNRNDKEIITDFTRIPDKLNSNIDDLQKDETSANAARNDSFLGISNEDGVTPGHVETNNDTSRNNQDNLNYDDSKIIKDEEASLENTAALLPHFAFENGTTKNVSDLTSEEIQDLQFDVPNNSTEGNIYIQPDSTANTTGETLGMPLFPDKNFNAKQDDNIKELNKKNDDVTLHNINMVEKNISKVNEKNLSHIPKIPASEQQKDSIRKIIFDMSEGPFASIEAEMGVLTEEEKEAFIKQEVALIQEVIEETFRKHNVDGPSSNRNSEISQNNSSDAKNGNESKEQVVTSPNLFQAHGRDSDREEYARQARSEENEKTFNDIMGQHKVKVEKIKNIAADEDDDLLMISFIGDSVLKDLETRRNKSGEVSQTNNSNTNQYNPTNNEAIDINQITNPIDPNEQMNTFNHTTATNVTDEAKKENEMPLNRTKREISGLRSSRTPLTQLISDPTTKLDVEKTFQNLGSIARHTFENPRAPMYHVRNMLGNAKNSVMSAASVPPNNFLIPSKYEIAKVSRNKELNGEKVGAVNQNMMLSRSGFGNTETGEDEEDSQKYVNGNSIGLEDTVQKLGGMVRESVQRGKDAVEHVNNVAADAKKFLATSKHTVPRLIVPHPKQKLASRASFDPLVGSAHRNKPTLKKKTVLIAPKILELQENILGMTQENPENFVGVGHILDTAGLSQPNQPEVQLQKIEYQPLNNMNLRPLTIPSKLTKNARKPPKKYDVKKEEKDQNAVLGAEQQAVTENLRDFMQRMHDEMREIVKSQYEERKRQRLQRTMKPRTNPLNKNKKDFNDFKKTTRQTVSQNQILGARQPYYNARKNLEENAEMEISPEELSVFTQASQSDLNPNFMRDNKDGVEKDLNIPVVLSRIHAKAKYDMPPSTTYAGRYPYQKQYLTNALQDVNAENTDNEEKVELFLPENLMKPFMGQPSESEIEEYMRLNGDEEDFERESSDVSKKTSGITKPINLNNPLAKVESLSPLSYGESIVPMKQKSPQIPLSLELSNINPFSSADPARTILTPELVGAAMPDAVVVKDSSTTSPEIAEKTKELVELLSDPEIEDSELPEANQNRSSIYLDSTINNSAKASSGSKTLPIEPPLQKNEENSLDKTNKNADDTNTHISTVKDGKEENQNLEDVKRTPSSNFKINSLTVGPVPDQNDLGYVLGAINPMMFERHFNERLQVNDTSSQDAHNTFLNQGIVHNVNDDRTINPKTGLPTVEGKDNQSTVKTDESKEDMVTTKELLTDNMNQIESDKRDNVAVEAQVNSQQQQSNKQKSGNENDINEINSKGERTSMNLLDPYKKPFMGYIEKDKMNKFLNKYNNNLPEENDDEQHEEHAKDESYKPNIEPVKNVVFSSMEGEDEYNNF